MITNFKIFEGKQIGLIYHWTDVDSLERILSENKMVGHMNYISFSRNKNLNFNSRPVKITFDGDKMSNKFKFEPHLYGKNLFYKEEAEERIPCTHFSEPENEYNKHVKGGEDLIFGVNKYIIDIEIDYESDIFNDIEKIEKELKKLQRLSPVKIKTNIDELKNKLRQGMNFDKIIEKIFFENNITLYHGSIEDFSPEEIKTNKRLSGVYLSTDKRAAKDYGEYIYTYKLKDGTKILDLSDSYELLDYMLNNEIIDKEDLDIDFENKILNGRLWEYDIYSKTRYTDYVVEQAETDGYDLVKIPDDLRGYGENIAWVVINTKCLIPQLEESIINEGKQVGILYHWTEDLDTLKDILESDKMVSSYQYISFSRNKNLNYLRRSVKIIFDGDKMSNHFKFEPHLFNGTFNYKKEAEERISCNLKYNSQYNNCIEGIKKYIIGIDVRDTDSIYFKDDIEVVQMLIPNVKINIVKR